MSRVLVDTIFQCRACGEQTATKAGGLRRCRLCKNKKQNEWRSGHPERRGVPYASEEAIRRGHSVRLAWLSEGDCTRDDLRNLYKAAGGSCAYCGGLVPNPRFDPKWPRGFDHLIPRPLGGRHTPSNLVVSCGPCNVKKGRQHPEAFATAIGAAR